MRVRLKAVLMSDTQLVHYQQAEASAVLRSLLLRGMERGLPALTWGITPDSELIGQVPRRRGRIGFDAWAEVIGGTVTEQAGANEVVLTARTESGLPGEGRRRIVITVQASIDAPGVHAIRRWSHPRGQGPFAEVTLPPSPARAFANQHAALPTVLRRHGRRVTEHFTWRI